MSKGGEYEPRDSRNITGTASTPDGRWTDTDGSPPRADGRHPPPRAYGEADEEDENETDDLGEDEENDDDDEDDSWPLIAFEPDAELLQRIRLGETPTRH